MTTIREVWKRLVDAGLELIAVALTVVAAVGLAVHEGVQKIRGNRGRSRRHEGNEN